MFFPEIQQSRWHRVCWKERTGSTPEPEQRGMSSASGASACPRSSPRAALLHAAQRSGHTATCSARPPSLLPLRASTGPRAEREEPGLGAMNPAARLRPAGSAFGQPPTTEPACPVHSAPSDATRRSNLPLSLPNYYDGKSGILTSLEMERFPSSDYCC